jgi:molybdopterin-containing oxidoreductase family iron-sulfur binding subunit
MSDRRDRMVLPLGRAGVSRRGFLRAAGYGVAAATLASCSRAPVRAIVSSLSGAEGLPAGRAYFIATTCGGCPAACGVLAECVDGRPVKLEGLPGHPVSAGGLCAVGQAQVLSLYDSHRLASPLVAGARASWDVADAAVQAKLAAAKGRVRLLTGTVHSPSTRAWIAEFESRFGAKHVAYDALSCSAIADAHRETHGVRALPRFRFDKARVIASFGADFLGAWISPVEFTAQWRAGRPLGSASSNCSKHWQIEARTSMTGLRADRRVRLAPWETADALAELHAVLGGAGAKRPWIRELAVELLAARGASLVVCDDGDVAAQRLVNAVNERLGNYGATLDVETASRVALGDDAAARALVDEMRAGAVDVVVVAGCNPAYDLPAGVRFAEAAAKVGTVVVVASHDDETTALAHVVLPEPHALESWNDAAPADGLASFTQPTIRPLRGGRTLRNCLARWCGDARDDRALLRAHWSALSDAAFENALREGYVGAAADAGPRPEFRADAVGAPSPRGAPEAGALALVLYPKVALRDGSQAHNAWLQELPDPVTKCVWDNYACLSPEAARSMGVATGDVVRIAAAGAPMIELPALVQPGQHDGVVAVALGYGRKGTDRFSKVGPQWLEGRPTVAAGDVVGRNAAPLAGARSVRVERTGARRELACTQDHHSLHVPEHLAPKHGKVRDAVRTFAFAELSTPRHEERHEHVDIWPADHPTPEHKWAMAVDLGACTGCSGCVVACQAENNVPVVGRDEVLRHREMQWIRIDRYYDGEGDELSASQQPMMCQHCANAPCETVCPVLATVHSTEGLNQQVYNRCVGTRYCANNCPYKARRFNWFEYPREDKLQNLALNPDVTVRTRGVMEKCSMCVQRIQDAKTASRRKGAPLADGAVRTACQQSCPAGAIVFGDLNDKESEVSKLVGTGRAYVVLGELNVKPAVTYLADVRNRAAREEAR